MEWIGVAGAIAGLAGAVVGIWARWDAHRALRAAKRSAAAAERSAGISAELFEQGKVRLELVPVSGSDFDYELLNSGTHPAYDVSVDAPQVHLSVRTYSTPVFRPGMRHPIQAMTTLDTDDTRVVVEYRRDPEGEVETAEFYV